MCLFLGKVLAVAGGCPENNDADVIASDAENFYWMYDDGCLFHQDNKNLVLEAYEDEECIANARVRMSERTGETGQAWRIMAEYEDEDKEFRPAFALGNHRMNTYDNNDGWDASKRKVKQYHTADEVGCEVDFNADVKDIKWRRPDEILPKGSSPKFIKDGVSRFDINQGNFGNCWAISVMANLAYVHKAHPEILDQVFDQNQTFDDNNHTFTFRFFKEDEWHTVTVDDYLPLNPRTKKLMCCVSCDPEEFWPSLMMKAYAKFKGSYADIEGGMMSVALNDMTGDLWREVMFFKDRYNEVSDWIAGHGLVLAAADSSGSDIGIVPWHAYSVTGFVGDVLIGKCVRVRNPWGSGEAILSEANVFNDKEDGEFVLKWDTFCKHFDILTAKASMAAS